jgi:hypothetical protein
MVLIEMMRRQTEALRRPRKKEMATDPVIEAGGLIERGPGGITRHRAELYRSL